MASRKTPITARDPQGRQIVSLFEAALNKAALPAGMSAQHLIADGGAFQQEVVGLLRKGARMEPARPSRKKRSPAPACLAEVHVQESRLRQCLPKFRRELSVHGAGRPLPEGATHLAVIPRWQHLGATYPDALAVMLRLLARKRLTFRNYLHGCLSERHVRQSPGTNGAFDRISDTQPNRNLLVVPVQMGERHPDAASLATKWLPHEFVLDTFSIAAILLANPEILVHEDDQVIRSGDLYAANASPDLVPAIRFRFCNERLECDESDRLRASGHCGTPSGFLHPDMMR